MGSGVTGDSSVFGGIAQGVQAVNNVVGAIPGTAVRATAVVSPGQLDTIQSIAGLGAEVKAAVESIQGQTQQITEKPLNQSDAGGRRVRLRPKSAAVDRVYSSSPLLSYIKSTNGMLWPYQPTISYQQDVDYKPMDLTHANQDIYAYHRTPSLKLTVDGEWSVQNRAEGLYAMSCIHFLRTVTKMNFGQNDPYKGTPPPVLIFDAYGRYMFNTLPVLVTGFTIGLPKDVDYVPIDTTSTTSPGDFSELTRSWFSSRVQDNTVWLPSVFNIQVNLIVQNSPTKLRNFNLENFRSGALVKQGGWV